MYALFQGQVSRSCDVVFLWYIGFIAVTLVIFYRSGNLSANWRDMPPRLAGKIELELKCPLCRRWFQQPLLLPCGHSVCASCAPDLVCSAEEAAAAERDFDQLSVVSETDSGVGMGLPSDSYAGVGSLVSLMMLPSSGLGLVCPTASCKRPCFLSERGVASLTRNKALERVVERFAVPEPASSAATAFYCQLCEDQQRKAVRFCEQCEVAYCSDCLESCHPSRGALAKHQLLQPRPLLTAQSSESLDSSLVSGSLSSKGSRSSLSDRQCCLEHSKELLETFCLNCKVLMCARCQAFNHANHNCQPAAAICKAQKVSWPQFVWWLSVAC